MKKIIYIANIRLPTEKAHGIQIAKTCEAFGEQGTSLTLIVPWRNNAIKQDSFAFYNVKKTFNIKRLFSLDLVSFGRIGFLIQTLSFSLSVLVFAIIQKIRGEKVIYYSRDEFVLAPLSLIGEKVFWEAHRGEENFSNRFLLKRGVGVITITEGLRQLYLKEGKSPIWVSPDGVDVSKFQISVTKDEARKKLGLPLDKKIIISIANLYPWKGVDVLADSAKFLSEECRVVFVGGPEKEIVRFKAKYGDTANIKILGSKPYSEIPLFLKAADVAVIPNTAKEDISKLYTSPMKLFEYMASCTPIVASDLPSLREILTEKTALFFEADNPSDLAKKIMLIVDNPQKGEQISTEASRDIMRFTWENRAKGIIKFIFKD